MNTYNLLLHVLHITCGVFWAGATLLMHFFFIPAVKKSGPEGGKMMQALLSTRQFPLVLTFMGLLTVIMGVLLVHSLSNGFEGWWFGSKMGIVLSTGGTCGIIALCIGIFINRPAAEKIAKISASVAASGNPPTADQASQLNALRGTIVKGLSYIAWLLLIATICMAGAHYI